MDMREKGNGKRNSRWSKMSMAVDFRRLAGKTGAAPKGNIFGQMRPDIMGREEPAGSPGAWVNKSVNMLKENMKIEAQLVEIILLKGIKITRMKLYRYSIY